MIKLPYNFGLVGGMFEALSDQSRSTRGASGSESVPTGVGNAARPFSTMDEEFRATFTPTGGRVQRPGRGRPNSYPASRNTGRSSGRGRGRDRIPRNKRYLTVSQICLRPILNFGDSLLFLPENRRR